ncbi:MAG: GerMN domain-containing protein [Clostridia bacterium]|nr:GerMN domain-containing protein [Clostridia bacterium]
MKKRMAWAALLLCCAMALSGCMNSPPDLLLREGDGGQRLISASTSDLAPDSQKITLYFRYGDSAYLAPEQREIQVKRNESLEKAITAALIQGPDPSNLALTALFPPGTESLAATVQGDILFITFNEAFLGRYADEPSDAASSEGILRRQLCLQSLAATMTEEGLCTQVQVLVYRSAVQTNSMRLQAGFLDRTNDDTLLPPVTRDENCLLTPFNTASLILQAWKDQDWINLYDMTAKAEENARAGEQSALEAFAAARTLTDFSLSPGTVSFDGRSAVLTACLTVQDRGSDEAIQGYPLLLLREGGIWKVDYNRLLNMMNGA